MSAEDILTFSLAANMDTNEIVRRLIGFDPEKANSIAVLIKKHNADMLTPASNFKFYLINEKKTYSVIGNNPYGNPIRIISIGG